MLESMHCLMFFFLGLIFGLLLGLIAHYRCKYTIVRKLHKTPKDKVFRKP